MIGAAHVQLPALGDIAREHSQERLMGATSDRNHRSSPKICQDEIWALLEGGGQTIPQISLGK
jgi:hypothetical protein